MNKLILFTLSLLTFNITSSFSQGIVAGQMDSSMTYYDFPDDTLWASAAGHLLRTSDSFLIDINQDGIDDILFGCGKSSYNGGSFNSGSVRIINNQGEIYTQVDSFLYFNRLITTIGTRPFSLNDSLIGPTTSYFSYLWNSNSSNHGPLNYFHLWDTLGEKYIGFNITLNNQMYYGWIRGEIYSYNGVTKDAFIVRDLAYQSFLTGLKEIKNPNITLYPNPVREYLNINGLETSNKPIQVLDITGKVILEEKPEQNQINLSQFSPGIYFLKIETNDAYEIKKIIKE